MASRQRIKATAEIWVAQSRDEVAAAIKQIGDIKRESDRLTANMNDEIAAITEKFQPQIDALKARMASIQSGVQVWCEAHRAELTQGGKTKTANLITGNVLWRQRPPSVVIRGVDAVLELLRKMGLGRFIRTKEEPNKEAMLNEPDAVRAIPGITVVSGVEDFVIEPFEQQTQ
ncbi:MAG: host-nuclease inhibitor protein Gam [Burkholderiaceae bacterium]|nr:host-nuclease inhibitor protein Gam [Burkholderiaceae bacterium]